MHTIHARNVNQALAEGLRYIHQVGEPEPSRDGPVLVAPHPVTTIYERPTERVLFQGWRDANPFFHLFESIWMLAGQRDASWLDTWVRDFSSRYAEPGTTDMWGTYGWRWRRNWDQDQLDTIVRRLRRNPHDRRVVLTMWDPTYDLIGPEDIDERGEVTWPETEPRDLPCNTHVYFRIRPELSLNSGPTIDEAALDMTVCCRSNDLVWGAYGANAVHFSVLQEYMAAAIGVSVGRYYQVSNNWHMYTERFEKMSAGQWSPDNREENYYLSTHAGIRIRPYPMVSVPSAFLRDCESFVMQPDWDRYIYVNEWFLNVAVPLRKSHLAWRHGDVLLARRMLDGVAASDWRLAAQQWLSRRA